MIEKIYRPFKDTDELIEKWWNLNGWSKAETKYKNDKLRMPLIWVRRKDDPKDKGRLITAFNDISVELGEAGGGDVLMMDVLFELFIFLDGSPCGVAK